MLPRLLPASTERLIKLHHRQKLVQLDLRQIQFGLEQISIRIQRIELRVDSSAIPHIREPLRFGRLFLAGDAGHIVPPTGAKGLNLAATDVKYLSRAFIEHYRDGSDAGLDAYSERCLRRVWRAERFSWWFTSLMHQFPDGGSIGAKLQDAELDYLFHSEHGARTVAENYVGLPLDFGEGGPS